MPNAESPLRSNFGPRAHVIFGVSGQDDLINVAHTSSNGMNDELEYLANLCSGGGDPAVVVPICDDTPIAQEHASSTNVELDSMIVVANVVNPKRFQSRSWELCTMAAIVEAKTDVDSGKDLDLAVAALAIAA